MSIKNNCWRNENKIEIWDKLFICLFLFCSINEPDKDPGYGQSILHEGVLIFRTPPYIISEITLQDNQHKLHTLRKTTESPKLPTEQEDNTGNDSHLSSLEKKKNRRFSSTSIK